MSSFEFSSEWVNVGTFISLHQDILGYPVISVHDDEIRLVYQIRKVLKEIPTWLNATWRIIPDDGFMSLEYNFALSDHDS